MSYVLNSADNGRVHSLQLHRPGCKLALSHEPDWDSKPATCGK